MNRFRLLKVGGQRRRRGVGYETPKASSGEMPKASRVGNGHSNLHKTADGRDLGFGPIGCRAIRSTDPENPTQNQTWSGSHEPLPRYGRLKFSKKRGRSVGRSSVVGPKYIHWCHVLLFATLGTQRARSKNKANVKATDQESRWGWRNDSGSCTMNSATASGISYNSLRLPASASLYVLRGRKQIRNRLQAGCWICWSLPKVHLCVHNILLNEDQMTDPGWS